MLAKVYSGAVYGVTAFTVEIEVNAGRGDPQIITVGLPDAAVKESKDRVWTALQNSGFKPDTGRVTVNLAPADIKKEGPVYDLPIAAGLLCAAGIETLPLLSRYALLGELALSGEVRRVKGVLPIALKMKEAGLKGILVPADNAEEAGVVAGLEVHGVKNLREAVEFLSGRLTLAPFSAEAPDWFLNTQTTDEDFADIKGQECAKRAVEVAVSGGHNILMVGSPGAGKTMLARRIPSILPAMTLEEALDATRIHSIAGQLKSHQPLISQRPFRAPHHTISDAGLLGGGTHPAPGEVSLAHRGVLFLDELPEFHRNVLEVLRQPLEDGHVSIARANATVDFPSKFMLVAAMNPCPCGYAGDPKRACRCTETQRRAYKNKISGPLLDRIDIHIEVPPVEYAQLSSSARGESSETIRQRVQRCRQIQQERFKHSRKVTCNAEMSTRDVQTHCRLDSGAEEIVKLAMNELHLTARAYTRILKVARTIADMDGAASIGQKHVFEAVQYRSQDRTKW